MKYTLITLTALAGVTYAQDLITNGSFENPSSSYTVLAPGSGSVPGWTVSGGDVEIFGINDFVGSGNFVRTGITPSSSVTEGLQTLDLSYGALNATITQTVNTTAGTNYKLSFDLGTVKGVSGRTGIANFALFVNGNVAGIYNVSTESTTSIYYESKSHTFTGTGSDTIAFSSIGAFNNPGGVKQDFHFIDNVSLTVVPEPSSTALLSLGGLALILRRRK